MSHSPPTPLMCFLSLPVAIYCCPNWNYFILDAEVRTIWRKLMLREMECCVLGKLVKRQMYQLLFF